MNCPVYGLHLVKHYEVDVKDNIQLVSPVEAIRLGERAFDTSKQTEEVLNMIAVDNSLLPVGFFEVARGALNEIVTNPREILKRALACNAHGYFLLHNHNGSVECELSNEDVSLFECLTVAGSYVGVECMDLIAVGEDGRSASVQQYIELEDK